MSKILDGLNEEQYQAASSIDGAIRLIAGAGSGKTFTLTRRVAYICEKKGIEPNRVLSVTFTNKASKEMSERVAKVMNLDESAFYMRTFHSLALDIVKRDIEKVFGYKSIKIANRSGSVLVPEFLKRHPEYIQGVDEKREKEIKTYLIKKVNQVLNYSDYPMYIGKKAPRIPLASVDEFLNYMDTEIAQRKVIEKLKTQVRKEENVDFTKVYQDYEVADSKLETLKDNCSVTPTGTLVREIIRGKGNVLSFDDIITCALYMLKTDEEILSYWQNRFDYIQVDEFQDTDSKQLEIVQLLYKRHGNLFVVGDPDQSIYLFRKAEPTLFNNLGEYIPNLRTIFMTKNYRSSDEIVKVSNEVIKLNQNRIPKSCTSEMGKRAMVEIVNAKNPYLLAKIQAKIIEQSLAKGIEPKEIAVLYRSTKDMGIVDLQQELGRLQIKYATTYDDHSNAYNFVVELGKYKYSENEDYLYNAIEYINDTKESYIDIDDIKALNLEQEELYNLFYKAHENYKKDGTKTKAFETWLLTKSERINEDIESAIGYLQDLTDEEKEKLVIGNTLENTEGKQATDGNEVQILTMHKSKGLEYKVVIVSGLNQNIISSVRDTSAECEEQARLAYVAYSRAKESLYLCSVISDEDAPHGVLGKVSNLEDIQSLDTSKIVLDKELQEGLVKEEDSKEKLEESVRVYTNLLDKKTKIVYRPLVEGEEIKGYRCEYSIEGEKIGYQARIEDLERLNCVPKAKRLLVIIGDSYKIVKEYKGHYYCSDEINKAIRVVDLEEDKDIEQVFKGSNNGYLRDVKDKGVLSELKKNIPNRGAIIDKILLEVAKEEEQKEEEQKKEVISKDKIEELKKEVVISNDKVEETKKLDTNKGNNLKAYLVKVRETKEVLGVRVENGVKRKDISIKEAKERGIDPNKLEVIYISRESKKGIGLTYNQFKDINANNKVNHIREIKIINVYYKANLVEIEDVSTRQRVKVEIDKVVEGVRTRGYYIRNASLITLWKKWNK